MPFDLSTELDPAKLAALAAIYASGAKPRVGEIVAIHWAGGSDTRYYSATDYHSITGFAGLAGYGIASTEIRFQSDGKAALFLELVRTSDIGDDKVDLQFVDYDQEVVSLYRDNYGEGTRVTVYAWFPEVDLLMETFWGHLGAPSDMDGYHFKVAASTGFRSPNMNLPHRTMYPGCQALFGGHVRADGSFLFPTLDSLEGNDCPYNAHIGGPIGTPGFTSCPRNHISVCTARGMEPYYLAFDFTSGVSSVGGGDHKWTATTRGNESNQNKALRVVFGRLKVRDLDLQAFQSQSGGSKPENGYLVSLWALCEGPIVGAQDFYVNDQFIGLNHQITNRGLIGQPKIPYPTSLLNYSGTALARLDAGPKDWRNTTSDDVSASALITGLNNVKVWSDTTTFTRQYTTNRAWALRRCYEDRRWGYGYDESRFENQDWIDLAAWCDDTVGTTDTDGVTPITSTRSTFNADLNERTLAQQITDICLGGRFGLPFNFNGKLRVIPLSNTFTVDAPIFTDQGADRNIVFENGRSSLTWSTKGDKEIVNQLKVTFDNEAYGWQPHKLILNDLDQQLRAGIAFGDKTTREVSKEVSAFGITNYPEAVRWAKMLLNLGEFDGAEKPGIKNNLRVKFTTFAPLVAALKLYPYCLIKVVNDRLQEWEEAPGFPVLAFRVMKMTRLRDQKMRIEAQMYPNSYYGSTEVFTASSGTPNPGGSRYVRPRRVVPLVVSRTLDHLTITTEEG